MAERDYFRHDWRGGAPRSPFWATYPATKALLITLVGVHLLMLVLRGVSDDAWRFVWRALSLQPDLVLRKFFVWQLVTAALLHDDGSLWHLLVNCLVIFFFGRMIEQRLGVKRYLLFCMGATVTASLAYLFWSVVRTDIRPMLGASGLGMGLIALAALWYPRTTVLLFFVFPMPLWVLALILVGLDLMQAFSVERDIAASAHLGGALYGLLYHRWGRQVDSLFAAVDGLAERQRAKKERRRAERELDLRRRVDEILDKVNREGMAALSEDEKRFLKQASARLRR